MKNKIFSKNFKQNLSRIVMTPAVKPRAFLNNFSLALKLNVVRLAHFQVKNFSKNELNHAYQQINQNEDDFEIESNPILNFLSSELLKIQEKKFSIEEYCLGLRSLENSKIPFEEIQTNIKEISHLLESLANEIVNSDYLNKNNIDAFIAQTSKIYFIYGINSSQNLHQIHKLCREYLNDISNFSLQIRFSNNFIFN